MERVLNLQKLVIDEPDVEFAVQSSGSCLFASC